MLLVFYCPVRCLCCSILYRTVPVVSVTTRDACPALLPLFAPCLVGNFDWCAQRLRLDFGLPESRKSVIFTEINPK